MTDATDRWVRQDTEMLFRLRAVVILDGVCLGCFGHDEMREHRH
jgi:hypothetical protein